MVATYLTCEHQTLTPSFSISPSPSAWGKMFQTVGPQIVEFFGFLLWLKLWLVTMCWGYYWVWIQCSYTHDSPSRNCCHKSTPILRWQFSYHMHMGWKFLVPQINAAMLFYILSIAMRCTGQTMKILIYELCLLCTSVQYFLIAYASLSGLEY